MVSKEAIKQAAFELFAEKGFEATSTQDIADAVGLKKQSLYSHFKSKNQIFEEVLKDQTNNIMAEIRHSIDTDQIYTAELFLKQVFATLIQSFSVRERLLYVKRTILLINTSQNKYKLGEEYVEQFNESLKSILYNTLADQYNSFSDPAKIELFYSYFMLHVFGYLEVTIMGKADEALLHFAWQKLWAACKDFFPPDSL
jgi:Transcriptional regulator